MLNGNKFKFLLKATCAGGGVVEGKNLDFLYFQICEKPDWDLLLQKSRKKIFVPKLSSCLLKFEVNM